MSLYWSVCRPVPNPKQKIRQQSREELGTSFFGLAWQSAKRWILRAKPRMVRRAPHACERGCYPPIHPPPSQAGPKNREGSSRFRPHQLPRLCATHWVRCVVDDPDIDSMTSKGNGAATKASFQKSCAQLPSRRLPRAFDHADCGLPSASRTRSLRDGEEVVKALAHEISKHLRS